MLFAAADADPQNFVKQDALLRHLVQCERFEVGRCRLSVSKAELKARQVSPLETKMR